MYLHLARACAIETACVHNVVLGVVNRHGRSYSMVSSIHYWRKKWGGGGGGDCRLPLLISRAGPHPQYANIRAYLSFRREVLGWSIDIMYYCSYAPTSFHMQ